MPGLREALRGRRRAGRRGLARSSRGAGAQGPDRRVPRLGRAAARRRRHRRALRGVLDGLVADERARRRAAVARDRPADGRRRRRAGAWRARRSPSRTALALTRPSARLTSYRTPPMRRPSRSSPSSASTNAKQRLGEALRLGPRRALARGDGRRRARRAAESRRHRRASSWSPPTGRRSGSPSGYGAIVVDDPVEAGQAAAAVRGVAHARELGAARALLVPGDCPALDPGEVDALLGRRARPTRARGDRPRPPRPRHQRAAADARRTRWRPPSGPNPRAPRRAGRAAGAVVTRSRRRRRSSSTSTRPSDLAALREALGARRGARRAHARVLERLSTAPSAAGR